MGRRLQVRKAERFRDLHHGPGVLVLPNIWDPLGALLLQDLGYPAVATASAAVAFSHGYDDGERMRFSAVVAVVRGIASCVEVPVSADVERGYAVEPAETAANVRRVLRAGAVGINIEDSTVEGGSLFPLERQCDRIRAVRAMAEREGVPLVINARTDVFLRAGPAAREEQVNEVIARANAYVQAGADCVYPIMASDIATLRTLRASISAPLNVYAHGSAPSLRELEAAGINRVSLGPGFLKASLTLMGHIARELRGYGSYDAFTRNVMSSDDVRRLLPRSRGG